MIYVWIIGAQGTLLNEGALVRERQVLLKEIRVISLLESVVKVPFLMNNNQYS